MTKKGLFLLMIVAFLSNYTANSQEKEKRNFEAVRITESPKIDGKFDDDCWTGAVNAKDFLQLEPYNGQTASLPSEVKIVYDDHAIYFAASLIDNQPDSVLRELSIRDSFDEVNADLFAVMINPFNDGLNAFTFLVSASGVQSDAKWSGDDADDNWDAVWESAVEITENGWNAELKIPYSAIRFPKNEIQLWGLNFFRKIRRYQEWSTWNFIDINRNSLTTQMGELQGIENIDPPLRLSVTPYVSVYLENDGDNNSWGNDFNAGMDLKWGINQSFTLDMVLIPDFGQVPSDDEVLNISPFEIRYDEKRPFFTEGTELFSKGNIFYSRRIGSEPINYDKAEDELIANEVIDENPIETKLINATKISGRTNSGLGIGFFNAMTGAAEAIILDTINSEKRKYQTQGFVNYNMLVLDQSLKNNSYISLANTNVLHTEGNYTANVTATELSIMNKENSYQISGNAALSQKYTDSVELGHKYRIELSKVKGNFLFELSHSTESDTYDANDMGYTRQNNESEWGLELDYNINEPFWRVLNWNNEIEIEYKNLYKPREFTEFSFSVVSATTFAKNHLHTGLFLHFNPVENHDYYETRVDGRYYNMARSGVYNWWISTDRRKDFSLNINQGAWKAFNFDRYGYFIGIGPRIRFSDRWSLRYNMDLDFNYNTHGHVDDYEETNLLGETESIIVFGQRDQLTMINSLSTSYIFSSTMSLNFRARHYWSRVEYDDYYQLLENGDLGPSLGYSSYGDDENYNYNAFTIDMKYQWRFAPGSEMALVWKNAIYTSETDIINNFLDNLNNTFQSSQINSISLKILYYLDYQYLVK